MKFIIPIILLSSCTQKPVLSTFVETKPKVVQEYREKRFKITEYYIPTIYASDYSSDNYPNEIRVDKKGKSFNIYVKSSKGLYTEGWAKIETETKSFYLSHDWEYSEYPKTADGGKLNPGDIACNSLKRGTIIEINGKRHTVNDVGGGLADNQIDICVNKYRKKTFYSNVKILN